MAVLQALQLNLPKAVAAGSGVLNTQSGTPASAFYLTGTFVATVQFQYSPNNVDWFNAGAALVAPGVIDLPHAALYVRGNVTVYTSGVPCGVLAGTFSGEGG